MTSPEAQYEEAVETEVTAEFVAAVAAAILAVFTAWTTAQTLGQGLDGVRRPAQRRLAKLRPDMAGALQTALSERSVLATDSALVQVARGIDQRATRRIEQARRLAAHAPMNNLTQVAAVMAPAKRAATGAQADTRWAATRAVSLAEAVKAKQAGAKIIWVPERNACLSCLAYAGMSVEPGELFPAGLTYGKTPAQRGAVPYPPLHPNCRCRVESFFGEQAIEDGLKREAQRSVARGFGRYDSRRSRLDAAQKVINRRNRLPKTVRQRAARDVQLGSFSNRHNVKRPDLAPGR